LNRQPGKITRSGPKWHQLVHQTPPYLDSPYLLLITVRVLAAVGGKFVACWMAARASGESQRIFLAVGSLMNARGLMELVALNISLGQKIFTPTLFAVLVIMAIVTTLMASPMFELVNRVTASDADGVVAVEAPAYLTKKAA
jgi:Kef-type K+ transport system membrane component KefB